MGCAGSALDFLDEEPSVRPASKASAAGAGPADAVQKKLKEIQAAYEQAMKDPETAKKVNAQMAQMQGMMNNPMVAKQMAAMNNMIANPDMQRRIAGLKDDPDFQEFFQDVQKNGPSAMMKYSNDCLLYTSPSPRD